MSRHPALAHLGTVLATACIAAAMSYASVEGAIRAVLS